MGVEVLFVEILVLMILRGFLVRFFIRGDMVFISFSNMGDMVIISFVNIEDVVFINFIIMGDVVVNYDDYLDWRCDDFNE